MTLEEIIIKAIPTDFNWIACPARKALETDKALKRRDELRERILLLINNATEKAKVDVYY